MEATDDERSKVSASLTVSIDCRRVDGIDPPLLLGSYDRPGSMIVSCE